ncbi:unnamed protein product, partial [Mesorhabditis spiculigera]
MVGSRFLVFVFVVVAFYSNSLIATDIDLNYFKEEDAIIDKFTGEGEFRSMEDMEKLVGSLPEIPNYKHYNYEEMVKNLQDMANAFPKLTHLYSIGRSVEGRELWVLAISRNPKVHTFGVPEVKYVANMHGDETTCLNLMLWLAWTLLNEAERNPWIGQMLDRTRIHLMPSMNPDGWEQSLRKDPVRRGRTNAHDVDLNRNFPSRFPLKPRPAPEPETLAVMRWSQEIPFVLSANFHGGTALVNYPWDDSDVIQSGSRYNPSPDNALFVRLSYTYARAHERMWKPGPRCVTEDQEHPADPKRGIINGAYWYIVSGGMQDWIYLHTNGFEVTVETNCVKDSPKSDLRRLWIENRYALLHYIHAAQHAISGRVYDEETNEPLPGTLIRVDEQAKSVTSFEGGEYWRLLNIGEYEVLYTHPGYTPVVKKVKLTRDARSQRIDVALRKLGDSTESSPNPSMDQWLLEVLPKKIAKAVKLVTNELGGAVSTLTSLFC